jgi:hypothetical protein
VCSGPPAFQIATLDKVMICHVCLKDAIGTLWACVSRTTLSHLLWTPTHAAACEPSNSAHQCATRYLSLVRCMQVGELLLPQACLPPDCRGCVTTRVRISRSLNLSLVWEDNKHASAYRHDSDFRLLAIHAMAVCLIMQAQPPYLEHEPLGACFRSKP